MSTALAETIDSLHITAARKLLHLLETITDPNLLAKLIATAFRYKLPKPTRVSEPVNAAAPPAEDREKNDTRAHQAPLPYTDEEFGELVVRYGEDKAAEINERREALIAEFNHRLRPTAHAG